MAHSNPVPPTKTKRKIKFSLRLFLLIVVAVGTLAGWRARRIAKHCFAAKVVSESDALQVNAFEDPIGPNFLYNFNAKVPNNGYFPEWFSRNFCFHGYFDCDISNLSPQSEAWACFEDLIHLRSLRIRKSNPPENWINHISKCRSLLALQLDRVPLNNSDIVELSKLNNLKTLDLSNFDIECIEFEILYTLKNVEYLGLMNCGITEKQLLLLQGNLPNCKIFAPARRQNGTDHIKSNNRSGGRLLPTVMWS